MKFFNSKFFSMRDLKVFTSVSTFSSSPDSFEISNKAREYLSEVSVEKDLLLLIFNC
mgnify:FL=1